MRETMKRMGSPNMPIRLPFALAVMLTTGAPAAFAADQSIRLTTREVSLGKIDARDALRASQEEMLAVSPDTRHVAYVARRGDKSVVAVDGREGSPFDEVDAHTLLFGPDSKRMGYA